MAACVLAACTTTATSTIALAQGLPTTVAQANFSGGTISDIRVEGTQRIEPTTVRSYLVVRPGDPFNPSRIDDSLKALFATGLFADVTLRREGNTLVVNVVENPIINRIAFEGNQRIEDADLEREVQLRPRVVYTRTRVQNDVQRLLEIYRRSGRFAATVEPKVIQLDQNRVDLVFEIDEGARTGVRRINFIGNEMFSDSRLREEIQTRESRWYRFLTTDDTYDPDRLTFDRDRLRRFYLSRGYADFRVVSAVAELTPDRDGFFITFTVEEGERYRFGKIGLETELRDLDAESLRDRLTTEEGDWYNAEEVETSIANLTNAVGDLQYAFVDIQPRIVRNRETRTIDVIYEIGEGPRVFVDRIDITGNVRTLDRVIRREMLLVEGDPFNTSKLRRSERRIRDLGFFERVNISTAEGVQPDRSVIQVDVQEQSTGEIEIGAGFSTIDGPLANFGIRERNLLGRGQDLRFAATVSGRTQEFDLSFTEPYFLERDLAAGIDLFRITRDNQDESSYDEANTGIGFRLGYPLTERLRQRLNYTLQQTEIENVASDASRFIREQEGSRIVSLVGQELLYDARDSRINPTEGYFVRLNNEVAGLGGDAQFSRNRLGAGVYFPVTEGTVLSFLGEVGFIVGIGEDVAISDRFFIGGDSLRGFAPAGIGPRELVSDDSLGGNRFARGSVELAFPIGLPDEFGVTGHTFTDFGTLGDVDATAQNASERLVDDDAIRLSIGAGISWRSPLGPIRVDLAFPILKEDYDKKEQFRFSFGTRF
ncbi:outer membrane protein assembly factor BamA [Skermanella mucosa]|uniref:outer membrane protein assembly factor BamA n=1 Tax=Skermanella mucosa TaxID=1789672 RepID=UPI001E2F15F4|nr:outer membrane protein assembly factor BamA [Skermanella mucosa]UEM23894.1 outer membrane protein assembly factor BamA [Skermanella mucosa]